MTDAENFTLGLIMQLENCVKLFSNENGNIFYEAKTLYKNGHKTPDYLTAYHIDLYYNSYIIRFSYYPHVTLSMAHSVLTCYVSFSKTDTQKLFYPLSQIYGFLGVTPIHALTIPMILSSDAMIECFDCIAESLLAINSAITDLSYNQDRKDALFNESFEFACTHFKSKFPTANDILSEIDKAKEEWYKDWICNVYEEPFTQEDENNARADFEQIILRINNEAQSLLFADKQKFLMFYLGYYLVQSLSSGYEAYMIGNYNTAIKKLNKLKNKTRYENLLINYMEKATAPQRHVPESVFKNLTELYKNGISKNNFKESLAIAPAMIIFGILWVPLFLALYFLFYFFESMDSIYLLGPLENAPSVIFPALLMAIPTIYFNSKRFYKLFFRKNYKKLINLVNATYSRSAHKFIKGLTVVLFVSSTVFLFLTAHQNIKLTEDGFYDNTELFRVTGTFYNYQDIEILKYQQETPDSHGGTFPYPSYVILLKNGEKIDIDQFDSCNATFLNVIKSKGVRVEEQNLT